MARRLDWVDRLAGVDTLGPHPIVEGEEPAWVLYPVGQWLDWPWYRRLLDLARARLLTPVTAAAGAAWYRVRHNPRNLDVVVGNGEDAYALIPASVAYKCFLSMGGIKLNYCSMCDDVEHVHFPNGFCPKCDDAE